jgi:hypothetical protein
MLTPLDLQLPPPGHTFRPAACRHPPQLDLDQMFLHVRTAAADGAARLMQYAIVDAAGQVRLSLFGRFAVAPADLAATPLEPLGPGRLTPSLSTPQALEAALRICDGAAMVTFGRFPQGALLPRSARIGARSLDCARVRFLKVAQARGLMARGEEVRCVNDALRLAGLPPVRSPDAALRALGLRQLSLWMDGTG